MQPQISVFNLTDDYCAMNRGQWSNVEDAILEAAVRRYGLNEWSRVSSLLAHRTARQCKARWYDHLSPSLEKRDWTPAEDARLVALAKAMPHAWRSVAAALSRPANAVVERFQQLVTQWSDTAVLPTTGSAPEFEAAIPDAVDLDEDQMEMLAEARARLANSKGRKEKRKARQKLLEAQKHAKILALRQEQRESGIKKLAPLRQTKSKFSIDYNKGIAFERQAPDVEWHSEEPSFNLQDDLDSDDNDDESGAETESSGDSDAEMIAANSTKEAEVALEQHYQRRIPFSAISLTEVQMPPVSTSLPRIKAGKAADHRKESSVDLHSIDQILKSLPPVLHSEAKIPLDEFPEQPEEPQEGRAETRDLSLFNSLRAQYHLPVASAVEGGTTLIEQELSKVVELAKLGNHICPSNTCDVAQKLLESECHTCTDLHPGARLKSRPYTSDYVMDTVVESSKKAVEKQYLQFRQSIIHEISRRQSLLDEIYQMQTRLAGYKDIPSWTSSMLKQQTVTVQELNGVLEKALAKPYL